MKKLIKLTLPVLFVFFTFQSMAQSILRVNNHKHEEYKVEVISTQGLMPGGLSVSQVFAVPPGITYIPNFYAPTSYFIEVKLLCPTCSPQNFVSTTFTSYLWYNTTTPSSSSITHIFAEYGTPIDFSEDDLNGPHYVTMEIHP